MVRKKTLTAGYYVCGARFRFSCEVIFIIEERYILRRCDSIGSAFLGYHVWHFAYCTVFAVHAGSAYYILDN